MSDKRAGRVLRVSAVIPLSGHGQTILRGAVARLNEEPGKWSLRPVDPAAPNLAEELDQWTPDGVLVQSDCPAAEDWCSRAGVPFVRVLESAARRDPLRPGVSLNDPAAGRMAAEYFRARGYRHFAFAGNGTHAFSLERQAGFVGWLQAHGHRVFDFVHSTPEFESGPHPRMLYHASMAEWLSGLPKPVALFAANDWEALAVAQACAQAGLSLPSDVSLLGAGDDRLICHLSSPELSSIKLPFARLGKDAATLLLHAIAGRRTPARIPAPAEPVTVIPRDSSADFGVANPLVRQALAHMNAHLPDPFTIASLLSAVGTSRPSLERTFKSELGKTPLVVLRGLRIERAKMLLSDTGLNNAEIAKRTGFSSNIRFVTVFRQLVGLPPAAYRETLAFEDAPH
jgi:LacI family transcriptional regulator